jgi:hypothetical protein
MLLLIAHNCFFNQSIGVSVSRFRLFQSRNNRLSYYFFGHLRRLYPNALLNLDLDKLQNSIQDFDDDNMNRRLNYYIKVNDNFIYESNIEKLSEIRPIHGTYSLDMLEYTRFFPQEYKLAYEFGDVTHVPDIPSMVKSRPVADNDNSILMKLDKVRHFYFANDVVKFEDKDNKIVWRGAAHQTHRIKFLEKFYSHSNLFDVGSFNKGNEDSQYAASFMTIDEQLKSKFILSIEGNDVATNTKWIMSSNSLCFMTKPKFETWFMEGELQPNYHYVLVEDDYSDLEEKVQHYIDNPAEAKYIISNANKYTEQFLDKKSEDWLNLKVLERCFKLSGQS